MVFCSMYICVPQAYPALLEAKRWHQIPGAGAPNICAPSCGHWESSLGILEEQAVLSAPEAHSFAARWALNLCL